MTTADFQRELMAMQDRYRAGCADRVAEIRALAIAWLELRDPEAGSKVVRALHRLAGSAGTFGFRELGAAALAAETQARLVVGGMPAADRAALRSALGVLEDVVARESGQRPPEPEAIIDLGTDRSVGSGRKSDSRPLVRFATSATEARFGLALREAGFRTATSAVEDLAVEPFALVASQRELERESSSASRLTIALLETESFEDRLTAARNGARAVLVEPVDEEDLVEALEELRGGAQRRPPRLIVVDDDAEVAAELARILQLEGMETRWLTRPEAVLATVRDFRPDMLLTDLHMPSCNGFELASIVRQDPALISLPVVFMSADVREVTQRQALRHDGDAFVAKSEALDVVVDLIHTKTRRARALEASMTTDSMTGLLRHAVFKDRLQLEVARCERRPEPIACVMIDIDHFKSINDRHGHATGDRVIQGLARLLRRRFRSTDLVGRYGGEEFAVALPQTSGERARRLIDDLRVRFSQLAFSSPSGSLSATFSAGIATYPEVECRDTLLVAADEALYAAKQQGRDRVCSYDPSSGRAASA